MVPSESADCRDVDCDVRGNSWAAPLRLTLLFDRVGFRMDKGAAGCVTAVARNEQTRLAYSKCVSATARLFKKRRRVIGDTAAIGEGWRRPCFASGLGSVSRDVQRRVTDRVDA